jgi:acyl dehydratase
LIEQLQEAPVTTHIDGIEQFQGLIGQHLGYSEYFRVTQEQVDLFADATGDHQWIHVDPERAKSGPFGRTIAHGYLTLSLLPVLLGQIVRVNGVSMGINYGTNKVRFPSPVPVGSEVRAGASVASVEDVTGGIQVVLDVTVEIRDAPKPSCAAQIVTRYYR